MANLTQVQDGVDGPLKKDIRDRISRFRSKFTLGEIGDALGFSGAFVGSLLNEKNPARVRSRHVPRILKELEDAEEREGFEPAKNALSEASLDDLVRAIYAKGHRVTLSPLKSKSKLKSR